MPGRPSHQAPLVWTVPEGLEGQAAEPAGGGGAWPDNESTRRVKLAARTTRGRAAAHGHTKQPGPASSPAPHANGWSEVRKLNGVAGRASS